MIRVIALNYYTCRYTIATVATAAASATAPRLLHTWLQLYLLSLLVSITLLLLLLPLTTGTTWH